MQALGLIETKGLIPAIEAADAMVKSANVSILEKAYVGGGIITVMVTGDVAAVKAAVESGSAAVRNISDESLISEHVIPRPHNELDLILNNKSEESNDDGNDNTECLELEKNIEVEEKIITLSDEVKQDEIKQDKVENNSKKVLKVKLQDLHKKDVDLLVETKGLDKTIETLLKLKVIKLRNLAREYDDFDIKGRAISKADKNLIISKFKSYYNK